MASARDLAAKRGETVNYFNLDQLEFVPELNARDLSTPDNVAHIAWLANEIKTKGFTSVMRVMLYQGKIVVTEGHCRTAACQLLKSRGEWSDDMLLPALTEPKGTTVEDLIARQMSGNGTSKALNPDEAAANIKRLMTFGKSAAQVAVMIGRTPAYVNELLEFQGAPTAVHKMVAAGAVAMSTAVKTLRKKGEAEGTAALKAGVQKAVAEGRTRVVPSDIEPAKPKLTRDLFQVVVHLLRLATTAPLTKHEIEEAKDALAKADAVLDGGSG